MYRRLVNTFGELPRAYKRVFQIVLDAVGLFAAVWVAYALRLGLGFRPNSLQLTVMAMAPFVAIPVFVKFGLYRAVLRYLPDQALWSMVRAMTLATLLWVAVVFLGAIYGGEGVPRSIPVIYWFVGLLVVVSSRFVARALFNLPSGFRANKGHTLIYGAGQAGAQLAQALRSAGDQSAIGFLDDNPRLHGFDVAGLRVYSPSELPVLIERFGVSDIVLSIPSAGAARRMEISGWLSRFPIKQRILPAITDLAAGTYEVNHIKDLDIEDLLGRTRVAPDPDLMDKVLRGRHVMITGAGGSIGSQLSHLVAKYQPAKLTLVDSSEAALYDIDRRVREEAPDIACEAVLKSVALRNRVAELFSGRQVDVILHAAAYKHVPLLESNPVEGMRNNVFGTLYLAEAAYKAGVGHFVLISSDKAVHPSSVMGATKRWSELIIRKFANLAVTEGTKQRFLAVRFGNVLGSTGSVVPLFKEQIANGGPVTLTDASMTRYFMAIGEAVELIVQAAALSEGGETFLLDMGEPVSIRSLAENMIRLSNMTIRSADNPQGDIEIKVIGPRPGEKLTETLFYDPSLSEPTAHPKIFRAMRRNKAYDDLDDALRALFAALETGDAARAKAILFDLVAANSTAPETSAESGHPGPAEQIAKA